MESVNLPTPSPTAGNANEANAYHQRRFVYGHCHHCRRPRIDCFCAEIPRVANRTSILILQHRRERKHPFNTVRIAERALVNCEVLIGYTGEFATMDLPIQPGAGLLYPGCDSTLLPLADATSRTQVQGELPRQLVILDGTWHHTKTFVRDIAALRALPRYRLAPASPSRYRIREEPTLQSLSTLEATVFALQIMEPATTGLNQLLRAFDRMVEQQLANPLNPHGVK